MTHGFEMIKTFKTRNKFSASSVDQIPHMFVGMLQFGHQLHAIGFADDRVATLDFGKDSIKLTGDDAVILAVPPYAAAALLPDIETPNEYRAMLQSTAQS